MPSSRRMDAATARRLGVVGLGVIGGAVTLGGLLWLIQRQLQQGRLIKVTLVHELDPATRDLAAQYQPAVQRMSERGLDVNMRLFSRKRPGEPESPQDLLTALVPEGAANRTTGYLY
jgi:hypothetical protein